MLAAQANLATSPDQPGLHPDQGADRRQDQPHRGHRGQRGRPHHRYAGHHREQDPMYVVFPISSRSAFDLRARYAGHGGFGAVRVRHTPAHRTYLRAGRQARLYRPDDIRHHRLADRARRGAQPAARRQAGRRHAGCLGCRQNGECARTDRRRVRPGAGAGPDTHRGAGRAPRGRAVGPAGRLRLHRGRPRTTPSRRACSSASPPQASPPSSAAWRRGRP